MLEKFIVTITGITPIIHHCGLKGLDTASPDQQRKADLTKKKGSNRTATDEAEIREVQCRLSIWEDDQERPTIPPDALRACIEKGARKLKQGPQVREGLIVTQVQEFVYDKNLGQTVMELGKTVQFTVPVKVQQSRIMSTRAKFDTWGCVFVVETDSELVDKAQLENWLDIAGRRVGLGDWRPEKSGRYGRFQVTSIEKA